MNFSADNIGPCCIPTAYAGKMLKALRWVDMKCRTFITARLTRGKTAERSVEKIDPSLAQSATNDVSTILPKSGQLEHICAVLTETKEP